MWIHISLGIHLFSPCCFLISILLVSAAILPALALDSLLCYYCPLQQKSKPCPQTTSQCMPDQRCAISTGNYGFFHILSSQGCVDSKLCGSRKVISYQGVKYNVSYTCCCKNQCNIPPKSDSNLKKLLDLIALKVDHVGKTDGLKEEPLDSCPNNTRTTIPVTDA